METLLQLYELPYDQERPLICFDERPCQLIGNTLQSMPMKPGKPLRENYEYEDHGTCSLLLAIEPLTGMRFVEIQGRRTKIDYAHFMKKLAQRYPKTQQIVLVQDNLNIHTPVAFYEAFEPKKAFDLAQCFEMQFTPKKASWLNIAKIELSAFGKQCLRRRIAESKTLKKEVDALAKERNKKKIKIQWRFTKNHARDKFKNHVYYARMNTSLSATPAALPYERHPVRADAPVIVPALQLGPHQACWKTGRSWLKPSVRRPVSIMNVAGMSGDLVMSDHGTLSVASGPGIMP